MSVRNLRSFGRDLDRFVEKLDARTILFQKKVAFLVLGAYIQLASGDIRAQAGVLQLTPVDTGRAVGNWQVTVGSPASGELSNVFGTAGGARGAAEQFATARAIRGLSGLRPGQSIWITNNLPYIVVLNDGGVNRQAHHMVERAIGNARAALSRSRA